MNQLIVCKGGESGLEEVPAQVKLLPLGYVTSTKGDFVVDEDSFRQMKQAFKDRGIDIVIDYEHQTLKDIQAPAAGWIKDLSLSDGAIMADVEWTQTGRNYLRNREYRYISPVIQLGDGIHVIGLHSAGLTNTPSINSMYSIVNSSTFIADNKNKEGGSRIMEFLKQLAALIGLDEEATEEDILKALGERLGEAKAMKEEGETEEDPKEATTGATTKTPETDNEKVIANKAVCELLGLKAGARASEVASAIMALSNNNPYGARVKQLEKRLAERDADDSVLMALKAGKITSAQKSWAKSYALKDPAGFQDFVKQTPQVVPIGEIEYEETKALKDGKPDEAARGIFGLLGVSDEDYKKYGRSK
ncbi:phage protease [Hungatella effluvii]|uniref:phage protease n=1 Tax=Hungatella effluvii TaxID=1096246 RepID=UPI0022E782FD|nr:phage protease [Hungatella effluvii]